MRDDSTRLILREFAELKRLKPDFRLGKVTGLSPLSVTVGDSATAYPAVRALDNAALAVGQVVCCAVWGHDLLVLGGLTDSPDAGVQHDGTTAGFALTTALQTITGSSVTVEKTGTVKGIAVFDFSVTTAGVGNCTGEIRNTTAGTSHAIYAIYAPATTGRATVMQTDKFAVTAGDVLVLRANKSINAGVATTGSYSTLLLDPA